MRIRWMAFNGLYASEMGPISATATAITQGTLYGVASQRPTVQSLSITINKVFSL